MSLLLTKAGPSAPGSGVYAPQSVLFNEVDTTEDDRISMNPLEAASRTITASWWTRSLDATIGRHHYFASVGGSGPIELRADGAGSYLILRAASSTIIAHATFTDPVVSPNFDSWHHWIFTCDMDTSNSLDLWVDDSQVSLSFVTFTTAQDIVSGNVWYPTYSVYDHRHHISELWISSEYINLGTEANRRRFISAGGEPVDLGSDGSSASPTSTIPERYHTGLTEADFLTNKGSGSNFTMHNGNLSDGETVTGL